MGLRQRIKTLHQRGIKHKGQCVGLIGRLGWAGVVGGQGEQRGRAGQLFLPIVDLTLQHSPLQPGALPMGIVGILNWQWRQSSADSLYLCRVKRRHFAQQDRDRPAIGDNVMHQHKEDRFVVGQLIAGATQQWSHGQVEGFAHRRRSLLLGGSFAFDLRQMA